MVGYKAKNIFLQVIPISPTRKTHFFHTGFSPGFFSYYFVFYKSSVFRRVFPKKLKLISFVAKRTVYSTSLVVLCVTMT